MSEITLRSLDYGIPVLRIEKLSVHTKCSLTRQKNMASIQKHRAKSLYRCFLARDLWIGRRLGLGPGRTSLRVDQR